MDIAEEELAVQGLVRLRVQALGQFEVHCVKRHRVIKGQLQFLTVYKGYEQEGAHWQPACDFVDKDAYNVVVKEYCLRYNVDWS